MHLQRESAAGVRFLAAIKEGRGLKASTRAAGVGKETGYRWLRESFLALRNQGLGLEAVQVELGYASPLFTRWDQGFSPGEEPRHHLRLEAHVEQAFWDRFMAGGSLEEARRGAGVGRSTAYRWWQARYLMLRENGASPRAASRQLRVPQERVTAWEVERRRVGEHTRREAQAAQRRAVRDSARHVEELLRARAPRAARRVRDTRYCELMRAGLTNAEACNILGMHRKTGRLS